MAQVIAQTNTNEVPSIIQSNARTRLGAIKPSLSHSANYSSNDVSNNQSTVLEHEAFPGELAMLRAQLVKANTVKASQVDDTFLQRVPVETPTVKDKHANTDKLNQNLLADSIIEVMPTGLVMLDGNGIVVKVNQVAINLLDEPLLGQPWYSVIARSFTPQEDDWHEISLRDGRKVKLEISSLASQPGQLIMITDLTETRIMQDKISQMQRLSSLGKMVSTLAHQIRTPLSAAILYGENLSSNQLPDESRLKFQQKLNARLQDLEQQVNDMLLFSKSGKEQVVAPLSVHRLITDSVSSMEALFSKTAVQVQVNHIDQALCILGNKNALSGALQNLLHNAIHALSEKKSTLGDNSSVPLSTEKPLIAIQVYSKANNVYLSVKDNGPGIQSKIADKIFQPFFTSSSKGTGLGLPVVKSVVNAHQGEVSLLPEQNSGAHFVIQLPLLKQDYSQQTNPVGELS